MPKQTSSFDQEPPESEDNTLEAWTGRYLDLIQRNWTAWLESTPAMFRAALAAAEDSDHTSPESVREAGPDRHGRSR
ncbi:MAG TPA: hypothetical protein VKA19_12925 [Alphaproteobacteria bacterium]|nr:hypothetical protein [Alphaproteobacteria bacterium]